jgi:hypothetical protein
MVLITWIAAFARQILEHGWSGFRMLGGAALSRASMQAAGYERELVPVLAVWAAFLLLAPAGYTIAFRSAAVAAGVLGALDFSPPSFVVTPKVAGFARELVEYTRSWNGIWLLLLSASVAYLLYRAGLSASERLGQLSARQARRPTLASPTQIYASQVCCAVLALVVLQAAAWSGTVVWLAARHAPGDVMSYGMRGALVQSDYLLATAVVAVLVACSQVARGVLLLAATALAASLGAVSNVSPMPRDLALSVGGGELARIAATWGSGSLWAALFVGFPACLLGIYLVARIRPARDWCL